VTVQDIRRELLKLFQEFKIRGEYEQTTSPYDSGLKSGYNGAASSLEKVIREIR